MAENSMSEDLNDLKSKKNFNDTINSVSEQFKKRFNDLPDSSREIFTQVDRQVRANPWMNIGLVAAGGMFLGFIIGKVSSSRVSRIEMDDAFDE
jgi:ElaB/YqjD/DUF883 family membrane-anchored ribosome-binding protein